MNRIRVIAGSVGLVAVVAGLVVAPASAQGGAAVAHHRSKLTVTVVPRHPAPGEPARVYVTGTLRGGRHYTISGGCIDDRCWQAAPSCARSSKIRMYREPVERHITHTFRRAGTHHVSLTLSAFCTRPSLPSRTVRTSFVVRPRQQATFVPEQPVHGQSTKVIVRSHARGGRFLMATNIRYGDGTGQAIAVDCIANPPKHHLHRDRYAVRVRHVWKKAKTYTMRITMTAPCTRPNVTPQHLTVTVPVS